MATRWEVTKAVRASDLPAPSRLVMLVLADVAEVGTAEIPERFTPSLSVLSRETGLSKSAVKQHLGSLESAGWVVRTRPSPKAQWEGERTRYRLARPESMTGSEVGQEVPYLGHDVAQGGPADDPGVGQEEDRGRPGAGHLETDHSDLDQISTDPPPSASLAIVERSDVEQICRHLADRIEANGSKRPTITKTWRDAARRLIDRDGRTVEQISRAIDWCQDDDFWRSNILSMPKLREKYDQLRLAAQRGQRAASKPSTTDQRVNQALALAAKYAEEDAS